MAKAATIKPARVKPASDVIDQLNQLAKPPQATTIGEEANFYDEEIKREHLKRLREENQARINFSNSIFTVTVIWMFLVLVIVYHAGAGKLKYSDGVLIALITTTTANVFGFFYVVVNYLFNKDKST